MKIRHWLALAFSSLLIVLSCSGCAEEEEYKPDYYVLVDTKEGKYHDLSCEDIPSGATLKRQEYNDAKKAHREPCEWCCPDDIYEYGSYIERNYSLGEKLEDIIQGDHWEIFPDYDDFDNVFEYFGSLVLSPIGPLFVLVDVFSIAFMTVCIMAIRLAVVCVACSPIFLLVWWIRKKRKERRRY